MAVNRSTPKTPTTKEIQEAVRNILKTNSLEGVSMEEILADTSLVGCERAIVDKTLKREITIINVIVSKKNQRYYWVGAL